MRVIEFDFPVTEITYKTIGERKLKLYIFEPQTTEHSRPAILFFNGGSFQKAPIRSPAQFQHQANYLSSQGIVGICVDYRNGHDEGFSPIQAICDAKSAIRWVRRNSSSLGIDPNKIVMCGASAGGYIAVSSIMFQGLIDEDSDQSSEHIPNALVIFAAGMDGVDIMSRRYPELLENATELSPLHNIKKCLPQTLWLCGTADDLYEQNNKFVRLMLDQGNDITFKTYEGMEHGFFNFGKNENKFFQDTTLMIEDFLKSLNFI
jgi:acetyl esterase